MAIDVLLPARTPRRFSPTRRVGPASCADPPQNELRGAHRDRFRRASLVQRRAAAVADGFDDPEHPQAIGGSLREARVAIEQRRQLKSAERAVRERWQHAHDVLWAAQLDAIKQLDETPLAGSRVLRRSCTGRGSRT